ncbi:hypothetical protein SAMN05421823_1249 [Catalinimonas alkaloidigena]|uniref:Uncharacterized protein n=1 Tax=Catalinimonas alkaloidigena TaxID=1075417 RepID=A0A1G9VU37_9BACT|nr:hypothetical protein [Catalinimonas alkaloidigena]SDM75762.1 hypothetical protein SAMN05421823_1249 [Catalinimonas alkaloidigena]
MKTRFIAALALSFVFSLFVQAQDLGDFKPKENKLNGANKFKSKDIYIANFSVNFQLYNLKTASTKGNFADRMLSGNTRASLAVGLDIPLATLQQITDEAYQRFVADLKEKGFTILNGDAAAHTKYYEGYQRFENMEMSLSEAPGMLTVYPTNTVFFVKGFTKDGQRKQGGISASLNRAMNNDGRTSIVDEISKYPKLSAELDEATIVNADLYILFLDVKKPYQGNGAKIVANTDLRMAAYEHINSRVANHSTSSKLGITGSTKEKQYLCVSAVDFVQGRNKIGGSPLGVYSGVLKEELPINGVVAEEKIQAYAKTDRDFIGTETAFGMMYRAEDIAVENTALIHADAGKYETGIKQALDTFLGYHVNKFSTKVK